MKIKKLLLALTTVACATTMAFAITSCAEQERAEAGAYYYDAFDGECKLWLNSDGTVSILKGNALSTGEFKEKNGVFTFTMNGGESYTATYKDNVFIVKDAQNAEMRFLRATSYTVSFDSNDGSAVESVQTLNGKTVARPNNPTRDGYDFVGWYADETYTTPWSFGAQVVTQDTTLYAYWVPTKMGANSYTVNFDLGYEGAEAMQSVQTVGEGRLFDVATPTREGYTFAGWWVSMYNSADKLSYEYTNETVFANDTTLYAQWVQGTATAPAVTVAENAISWKPINGVLSYTLTVTNEKGEILDGKGNIVGVGETDASTTRTFDFSKYPAGDYTVTVTAGANSTVRYYKNKALANVSFFEVVNSTELTFQAVEGAERYYITVDCGNDAHVHTEYALGNATSYNFNNCLMQEGGIVFTVRATANGKADSVSMPFVFERSLAKIEELKYDAETETITWYAIPEATSYVVNVKVGTETVTKNIGNRTSFCIKEYPATEGVVAVSVVPYCNGYNVPVAAEGNFEKARPVAPSGLAINGTVLTWNNVGEGVTYKVSVNGEEFSASENTFDLLGKTFKGENSVSVSAIKDGNVSLWSDAITFTYGKAPQNLRYENGKLVWDVDASAFKYEIKENGSNLANVEVNEYKPNFTQSGTYTYSVRAQFSGEVSDWVEISVEVYEIYFDVRMTSTGAVAPLYVAYGDELAELPVPTNELYDFAGWYNTPRGAEGNGSQYVAGAFNLRDDVVYYGAWTPKTFKITYNVSEDKNVDKTTADVVYSKPYALTVPTMSSETQAFIGWFTAPNAGGIQLTDAMGEGLKVWEDKDLNVYAAFADVLKFTLTTDGTNDVYAVEKGPAISSVTRVKIPATYNNLPVSYIGMGAFYACSSLQVIDIPDSIKLVGASAGDSTSSGPFAYCSKLREVNIYETDGVKGPYSSADGVLLYDSPYVQKLQIAFFPTAKTGEYTVADGVELIPYKAFAGAKMSKVTIPASVEVIEESAFFNCASLEEVVFLSESQNEAGILMHDYAFQNCRSLRKVTLPKYIADETVVRGADAYTLIFSECLSLNEIAVDSANEDYSVADGVLFDKSGMTLVYYPSGLNGDYVVPQSVQTIGVGAFKNHALIRNVTIPDTVKTISVSAFENAKVTGVVFTGSALPGATEIGDKAFKNATALFNVVFEEGSDVNKIGNEAFADSGLTIFGLRKADASDLTSEIPNTVTAIGEKAFSGVYLRRIVFQEGTNDITLGAKAFENILVLTDVTVSKGVKSIDLGVFGGCVSLREIIVTDDNPNYSSRDGVLYSKDGKELLFYAKDATKDTNFANVLNGVTKITANAFANNHTITSITIGADVTEIGEGAFANCTLLASVTIAEGNKDLTIGNDAFKGCIALTTAILPARTTNIPDGLFEGAELLANVTINSNKITHIGRYAFKGTAITSLTLPATVTTLGESAFEGCAELTSIVLPNNVSIIPEKLFMNCRSLSSVNIPTSVTQIGMSAFENAPLSSLVLPDTLVSIDERAFYTNAVATSLHIPKSVTQISKHAFYSWLKLTDLTFEMGGTNPLDIATEAFASASSLQSVVLPSRVMSIKAYTFKSASSLKNLSFENDKVITPNFEFEKNAFNGIKFTSITLPEGLNVIGTDAFYQAAITSLEIPSSVSSIITKAFRSNTKLKTVVFNGTKNSPELTIEQDAFYSSTAIESIVFPANLKSITMTLATFSKLKTIDIENNDVYEVNAEKNALFAGNDLILVAAKSDKPIVLKEGITSIGANAFEASTIEEIVIPASVKTIGDKAFYNATKLKTVTFAEGSQLKSIGDQAFYKTVITEIVIPNSVETLHVASSSTGGNGKGALSDCAKLEKVVLPASLKTLERGLFYNSKMVSELSFGGESENFTVIDNVVFTKDLSTLVYYPNGKDDTTYQVPAGTITVGAFSFFHSGSATSSSSNDFPAALTKIIIPKSVTALGDRAFALTKISEIEFEEGSNLREVGEYLFSRNTVLKSIVLPDTVETIGTYAFYYCSQLTSVHLPEGGKYKTVTNRLLANCAKLTEVNIPASVTSIGTYSFGSDTTSVKIPLESITLPDGLVSIGTTAFKNCINLKSVTIPDSVTKIETCAFENCTSLTSISLPRGEDFKTLNANIVLGCTSLKKIVIPANVQVLAATASQPMNKSIEEVIFEEGSKLMQIGSNAFRDGTALKTITIPASVKTLDTSIFYNNKALEEVIFEDGIQIDTIPDYFFKNAVKLKKVVIPMTVTTIGLQAFYGCTALEEVQIISGVVSFGEEAFYGCSNLKELNIVDSLKAIGTGAFINCAPVLNLAPNNAGFVIENGLFMDSFKTHIFYASKDYSGVLKIPATVNSIDPGALSQTNYTSVEFPLGMTELPESILQNNTKLQSVVIPKTVTLIGESAFAGCTALQEISLPENVTTIKASAFSGCTSLEKINLEAITSIGVSVFTNCKSLDGVTLNREITAIPNGLFTGCDSLTSIVIPENVGSIGQYAFDDCDSLSNVNFEGGVTLMYIDHYAFRNCTSLVEIELPSRLRHTTSARYGIGKYAFQGCENLTTVTFEQKDYGLVQPMAIASYAFDGCTKLANIMLPEYLGPSMINAMCSMYVEAIAMYAFRNCTSLTTFPVPQQISHNLPMVFGVGAFEGCTGLKEVYLPDNATLAGHVSSYMTGTIGSAYFTNNLFKGCTSLETVSLPASCEDADATAVKGPFAYPNTFWSAKSVFEGCTALKNVTIRKGTLGDGTLWIGPNSFKGCTALETITMEEGVKLTRLFDSSFSGCSLKSFEIPATLKDIVKDVTYTCNYNGSTFLWTEKITAGEANPFKGLTGLNLTVNAGNTAFKMVGNALYSADGSVCYYQP